MGVEQVVVVTIHDLVEVAVVVVATIATMVVLDAIQLAMEAASVLLCMLYVYS
jgi:hypothetical protein